MNNVFTTQTTKGEPNTSQVDDFAIACEDKTLASSVITNINSKITIRVKELGLINRFNSMYISYIRDYVKLYNKTYLNKIF